MATPIENAQQVVEFIEETFGERLFEVTRDDSVGVWFDSSDGSLAVNVSFEDIDDLPDSLVEIATRVTTAHLP